MATGLELVVYFLPRVCLTENWLSVEKLDTHHIWLKTQQSKKILLPKTMCGLEISVYKVSPNAGQGFL